MSGELSEEQRAYFNSEFRDFWNLYLITECGGVRRVSMPNRLWAETVWLMRENTDVEPEFFDAQARNRANADTCRYAEALADLIDEYFERAQVVMWFATDAKNTAYCDDIIDGFIIEQRRRERLWREAHKEWRTDLPPAFD